MSEDILLQIAGVIVLGIAAQWLATRLRLPSILLLLFVGFVAGPITGFLHPDELLGDLLFPFVSVSVGIILFEGGLSLKLTELHHVGSVVRNLISVGALVTWVLSSAFAYLILGFGLSLAIQLGAILVVTGPTVVIPLLRFVRPSGTVTSILRWEGILIDPVGATLALLVFEFILRPNPNQGLATTATSIILTILVGGILGYLAGRFLELVLSRYWVPDHLQMAVALMTVVGVFVVSNQIQHESGLLATTIMGITLANQKSVSVRHLVEFKENLGVLLLSSLFILLAARLRLDVLASVGLESLLFLAVLILIVRPLTVWVSTLHSPLNWRERLFLTWMAPRGIVAASVASVFALRLVEAGYAQAEQLVSVTFIVIVGTCTFYGLTALPLARRLNLSQPDPQGVLLVGAHPLAVAIGQVIQSFGLRVLLVDTNADNLDEARRAGLETYHGNILSENTQEELDLQGIGYLVAMTSNDEVNGWANYSFMPLLGRANVYQLAPKIHPVVGETALPSEFSGRLLFRNDLDYNKLTSCYENNGMLQATMLTDDSKSNSFQAVADGQAIPLFAWDGSRLAICATDTQFKPQVGQTVVRLVQNQRAQEVASSPA